jgi:hypothetical protein
MVHEDSGRGLTSILLSVFVLLSAASAAAQVATQPAPSSTLTIAGDVRTPQSITATEMKALPRTSVEVTNEDGRTVKYEGVLVGELLKRAGATLDRELRGSAMTTYVLASARDGYQVVFSLAELDPAFSNSRVIVADTVDGKPLFAYQGPLRIVSPGDTRPARSIRMLERLEVVRLKVAEASNPRRPVAGHTP